MDPENLDQRTATAIEVGGTNYDYHAWKTFSDSFLIVVFPKM